MLQSCPYKARIEYNCYAIFAYMKIHEDITTCPKIIISYQDTSEAYSRWFYSFNLTIDVKMISRAKFNFGSTHLEESES